jgi:hypothetical protein
MSNYNNKSLFLEPEVKQYGSHMVMTNVSRYSKRKFINIDSKYRDDYTTKYQEYEQYKTNSSANFNITLPERINDVKSITVSNAEVPMSFHNFSATLGNNCLKISTTHANTPDTDVQLIRIPNGEYTAITLETAIRTAINGTSYNTKITCTIDASTHLTTFAFNLGNNNLDTYKIEFNVDENGGSDSSHFKHKLGWLLGFRKPYYSLVKTAPIKSENYIDLNTVRYLYLVIDEYTKGNQNSFISPMRESLIRKNIIAKITLNKTVYKFSDILPANNFNGYLLTDRRNFTGKVDLQKLNIQLVDETGNPVDLNGLDFSFCLEVEHE